MLNYSQQRFYLDQMGVVGWYARQPLSGAASSRPICIDRDSSDLASSMRETSSPKVSSAQAGALASSLMAALKDSIVLNNDASIPALGGASTSVPSIGVPFTGSSIQIPSAPLDTLAQKDAIDTLTEAVLTDVEVAQYVDVSLPVNWLVVAAGSTLLISDVSSDLMLSGVNELAKNMLKSLDAENFLIEDAGFDMQYFSWPIFSNTKLPGNDAVTMKSLFLVFLKSRVEYENKKILVFGDNASNALLNYLDGVSAYSICFTSPASLSDMLNDPSLKSEVWLSVLDSEVFVN